MVKLSKIVCGVLACMFVDPCLAGDNETTYVTTTPIFTEWDNGASNMTVTLGVINADYAWKFANGTLDIDLEKRTGITITKIKTTVKAGTKIIATVKAGIEIYEFLAGIIKSKSDANSCTLTYGTDISGDLYYGYAYKATTTGIKCDTTAIKKTILSAVEKCATTLHNSGTTIGCCAFNHGGTWHGHLRLSAEPSIYPVHTVDC
ncbi:uncharacterized protein CDV56_102260 [Aspergillus thermomutatus]|uniref:Secreted protein CSS2 C-terminal domain-containing protein n=1 Tax=Aspergillus thermomutatus TaxID=41047 RepID=A0A397G226_ASPTH|nr:uncharacterized protein CDV56_102260 [Aspergillus thermomutatus]RHZ45091.1 hypothetical protein CDV56_102260 [Aspergillus thermomutatus]